jgi:ABC-type iron transport system FetAB permease component
MNLVSLTALDLTLAAMLVVMLSALGQSLRLSVARKLLVA